MATSEAGISVAAAAAGATELGSGLDPNDRSRCADATSEKPDAGACAAGVAVNGNAGVDSLEEGAAEVGTTGGDADADPSAGAGGLGNRSSDGRQQSRDHAASAAAAGCVRTAAKPSTAE